MHDLSWLAPTIAAFGAFVVGVITVWKSGQIHTLVNSAMTRVKADLAISEGRNIAAERRIEALEETIVRIQGKDTTEGAEPK
jgi:hypothetical protein